MMAIFANGTVSGRWGLTAYTAAAVGAATAAVLCTVWRFRSKKEKLSSKRSAHCVQDVALSTEASYYLLSRGGDRLRVIAARHGVRIKMDSRKTKPDEEHVYRVSGPTVSACENAVRDLQEMSGPARRAREGGNMAAPMPEGCQRVETAVPRELLQDPSYLTDLQEIFIGLRMHTGVKILLLDNGQDLKVSMSGSPHQQAHSYFVLNRYLNEKEFKSNAQEAAEEGGGRPPLMVQGVAGAMSGEDGDLCPLFVSALDTLSKFWVRLISMDETNKHFQEKMSAQYRSTVLQPGPLLRPRVGDLVAARLVVNGPEGDAYLDDDWYRCVVTKEVPPPEGGVAAAKYGVSYIDFGDTAHVLARDIRHLHARYCCLPVQAIPACLSTVRAVSSEPAAHQTLDCKTGTGEGRTTWPDDAIDEFERMAHCAKEQPMVARLATSVPDDCTGESGSASGEGGRVATYLGRDPECSLHVTHLYDAPSVRDVEDSPDATELDIVRTLVVRQMAAYV